MQAVGFHTATGVINCRVPEEASVLRFWHQVPDRWRVEDDQGVWQIADGQRQLVRNDGGMEDVSRMFLTFGQRHPSTLLGVRRDRGVDFDWLRDFATPTGPGSPVTVAGRPAWEFALESVSTKRERKPYPLRVAVDEATGTVLRMAMPEVDYVIELVEFTPDTELPEDVFSWDGPVSTRREDERAEHERARRWLDEAALPMPRWWPRGFGFHGGEGDPATGAYRVMLDVPGYPELCRWPAGTPRPESWVQRYPHVHSWRDERWEWTLALEQALADEDLAKVIESIPKD
jgi:hypothetical protein